MALGDVVGKRIDIMRYKEPRGDRQATDAGRRGWRGFWRRNWGVGRPVDENFGRLSSVAKIHVLEIELQGESPNRTGTVRCLYHVNISTHKNSNLDVTGGIQIPAPDPKSINPQIRSATVTLGASEIDLSLSTHPDFGVTTEDVLLTQQDIAEVDVDISYNENESLQDTAARLDGFYNGIQTRVQNLYDDRFEHYGVTRNPT